MFPIPCFIVSDANYESITCNSNPLLIWPLPRCNEDPDCRNPCGFRIAMYLMYYPLHYTFDLKTMNNFLKIVRAPNFDSKK